MPTVNPGAFNAALMTALASGLLGCASPTSAAGGSANGGAQTTPPPPIPTAGQLRLLPPFDVARGAIKSALKTSPAFPVVQDQAGETLLIQECTAQPVQAQASDKGVGAGAAGLIDSVLGGILNWGEQEISSALQGEIAKYKQQYKTTASGYFFYKDGQLAAGEGSLVAQDGKLSAAIRCFRYSKLKSDAKSPEMDPADLAVDIVGEIHIEGGGQAFQVRPLRLYVAQSKIPGSKDVTFSAEISAQSVWRENTTSKSQTSFDNTFVSEKIPRGDNKAATPYTKFFFNDPKTPGSFLSWNSREFLTLPPISVASDQSTVTTKGQGVNGANLAAPVNVTVTVAEVGTPPVELQWAADFFKSQGGALSTAAATALETQLGLKPSTSATGSNTKGQ